MSKKVTIMAEQNGKKLASRIQNNIQKVLVGKAITVYGDRC